MHSQTRKHHQKMLIDMILSIKKNNAKKQKMSSSEDHVSYEDLTRPVRMMRTVLRVVE
ncbi:hypothetical protein GIB67_012052, partial [Kingdonia uniflora]